jgi:hypothetical protein
MLTRDLEELRQYQERLQSYSTEELEDIYFRIHILRQPLHYNLLVRELESRKLLPGSAAPEMPRVRDLRLWLETRPFFVHHHLLKAISLALLLFLITMSATFLMLAPIWFFAVPLRFLGFQTAIVYFACAPIPPILAIGLGGKLGARGLYGLWSLLGVAAGMFLFNATGAPAVILHSLIPPEGMSGGGTFGGF